MSKVSPMTTESQNYFDRTKIRFRRLLDRLSSLNNLVDYQYVAIDFYNSHPDYEWLNRRIKYVRRLEHKGKHRSVKLPSARKYANDIGTQKYELTIDTAMTSLERLIENLERLNIYDPINSNWFDIPTEYELAIAKGLILYKLSIANEAMEGLVYLEQNKDINLRLPKVLVKWIASFLYDKDSSECREDSVKLTSLYNHGPEINLERL